MASAPRPTGDAQAAVAAIGSARWRQAQAIRGLLGGGRRASGAAGDAARRGCGCGHPLRTLEEEALFACWDAWTCSVGSGGASQVRWCLAPGGRVGVGVVPSRRIIVSGRALSSACEERQS
eukprot:scaffold1320_cov113-Isochrysis_galbana.AAC.2